MQISKSVALLARSLELLSDAFVLVSDRHAQEPEIRVTALRLAGWTRAQREHLRPLEQRFGRATALEPERVRAALFHDPRIGAVGLLRDLQDLALLAAQARGHWTALRQAALALHDAELAARVEELAEATERQRLWIESQVKVLAPQALLVDPVTSHELRASVPLVPSPAAVPDVVWAPLAGAVLLLAVGAVGLLAGRPLLVASLGPSAYLVAAMAAHPSARPYNVVVGHLIGLASGFGAVAALGVADAPNVLAGQELVAPRVFAAALALLGTVVLSIPAKAVHPPAGATALLVALGALQTSADALNVAVGAGVTAAVGAALRFARSGSWRSRPEALPEEVGAEPARAAGTWQPTATHV